jgi:hypothetical protein
MYLKDECNEDSPAFVLAEGDRFYKILVSDDIAFEYPPNTASNLTFFVIRRAHGLYDIVHVMKTYEAEKCIRRSVNSKLGVKGTSIESEVASIQSVFSTAIKAQSGITLRWHTLDLADVEDTKEQVRRIQQWGRVRAFVG